MNIKKVGVIFFITIFLLLVCGSGYLFYQYQMVKKQLTENPIMAEKTAQEQTKKLVSEISKLMVLPQNETPTLATVTDIKKLKDQPFFRQAKNGDQLLIFTKEKVAILYDPKAHKIVNVGPINTNEQDKDETAQVKIVLRNGTDASGLTHKAEKKLQEALPDVTVINKEQAARKTYKKTTVVVLNTSERKAAEALAKFYNVSLSDLPDHEEKPKGVDVLVILGEDQILEQSATSSAKE